MQFWTSVSESCLRIGENKEIPLLIFFLSPHTTWIFASQCSFLSWEYSGLPRWFPLAWPWTNENRNMLWAILMLLLFVGCPRHLRWALNSLPLFLQQHRWLKNPTRSPSHSVSFTKKLSDVRSHHSGEILSQLNLVTATMYWHQIALE